MMNRRWYRRERYYTALHALALAPEKGRHAVPTRVDLLRAHLRQLVLARDRDVRPRPGSLAGVCRGLDNLHALTEDLGHILVHSLDSVAQILCVRLARLVVGDALEVGQPEDAVLAAAVGDPHLL